MRILLDDGMQIPLGTGIGKYSEHLAKALADVEGVIVDVLAYEPKSRKRQLARFEYLSHINSCEFMERAKSYDLCIFTNYAMPFRKLRTKTAVTIHDLAVYDCPETLPKLYVPYGRVMIENAVRRADAVVTVSKTMLGAINERFSFAEDKSSYAWPGVYSHVGASDEGNSYDDRMLSGLASSSFLLMVGTVEKRKNIEFVIEAFDKFKELETGNYKLVLAGRPGFGFAEIEARANLSKHRSSIVFTGYVSDNDCRNLYRDANALIFPSVYEGFGSIQTECMAMDLPLILSDIPTNREVSNDWGFFFQLGNVDELAAAMSAATKSKTHKGNCKYDLMARFNWSYVADCYLATFDA